MTRNYAQIVEALEMFAQAHPGIQRFQSAFFDKINSFTTEDNTWPIMYATPQDVSFNQNTNVYRFRIYVLDVLQKDRSNQPYILLATSEIQRDLVNWIRDPQNPLDITNNPSIITVNNFGTEGTCGWYMDLSISAPAITTECSLPFPGLEVSGLTCDYTYVSDFITCDDLNECPIIIDINDRIDAIVVSADTFVVNGSYNNPSGTLTLERNDGELINITGFTTGATGGNDIYVTGGTFNAGTETLTLGRNDNQTVVITGFTSGGPSGFDVFVTGGTYNSGTSSILFTNNTGGTFSVTGITTTGGTVIVGGAYLPLSGGTVTGLLGATDGFDFTANGNDVTQIVRSGNADLLLSHTGSGDIVISSSGSGTILQDGTEFQQDITVPDEAYGATWNNSLEVPTKNAIYDKIQSLTDIRVTGGTYNNGTGIATFTNNTGGTFNVTGFTSGGGGGGNSIGELTGDVTAGPASSSSQSVVATVKPNLKTGAFGITIDGLGGVISSGQKGYVSIPYDGIITGWDIFSDTIGSCVIDVWKDTYGNFPPTVGDSIAGSEKPTLSGQIANRNNNLTGWTTTITAGDVIGFNVQASPTGVTRVNLIIKTIKS